jgi:hypothetical protein
METFSQGVSHQLVLESSLKFSYQKSVSYIFEIYEYHMNSYVFRVQGCQLFLHPHWWETGLSIQYRRYGWCLTVLHNYAIQLSQWSSAFSKAPDFQARELLTHQDVLSTYWFLLRDSPFYTGTNIFRLEWDRQSLWGITWKAIFPVNDQNSLPKQIIRTWPCEHLTSVVVAMY